MSSELSVKKVIMDNKFGVLNQEVCSTGNCRAHYLVITPSHHHTLTSPPSCYITATPQHIRLLREKVREALPDDVPAEESDVITSRVVMDTHVRHVVCFSHVNSPYSFYVNPVHNSDR